MVSHRDDSAVFMDVFCPRGMPSLLLLAGTEWRGNQKLVLVGSAYTRKELHLGSSVRSRFAYRLVDIGRGLVDDGIGTLGLLSPGLVLRRTEGVGCPPMLWLGASLCALSGGAVIACPMAFPGPISSWSQSFVLVRGVGGHRSSVTLGTTWCGCFVSGLGLGKKDRPMMAVLVTPSPEMAGRVAPGIRDKSSLVHEVKRR
jgi:hypothetical protein